MYMPYVCVCVCNLYTVASEIRRTHYMHNLGSERRPDRRSRAVPPRDKSSRVILLVRAPVELRANRPARRSRNSSRARARANPN